MLDEEHAAAELVADASRSCVVSAQALGVVEPGGRLVEQQEPRRDRDRAGDADAPLVTVRERARRQAGDVPQLEALEQLPGPRAAPPAG